MPEPARSAALLAAVLASDSDLLEKAKTDPHLLGKLADAVTKNLPQPALIGDSWIYRIVVIALGLIAATAATGGVITEFRTNTYVPDMLTALGSAAIGALAGLLAPSPVAR